MPRPSMKHAILEHGRRVIHERGYHAAGIAEIAAAAGVPKGSFYNHFQSKEAFAKAALDDFFGAFQPVFDDVLNNEALSGNERVSGFADALVSAIRASDYAGCLMGNLAVDASLDSEMVREAIVRRFASWQEQLANAFAAGQADGTVSKRLPPDLAAGWIISAFEGAALRARVERGPRPLVEFSDATRAFLKP